MSEKNKEFKNWEEVIVDFFENKVKNIKSKNPEIPCKLYKARNFIKTKEIRKWIELNHNKKIAEGDRTIKATHVLKFTHSSSNPGGLLLKEKSDDLLLSTASLKRKLTLDLAHNNGALITISRFLALKLSEKLIIDLIFNHNFDFLKPFSKDKNQLANWQEKIVNLIEQREIRTADKAKQTYFPLEKTTTEKYHLITPLFASSLCNEIDVVINDLKYGEQKKNINKCRNNKKGDKKSPKYHQSLYVDYPNLAVQNFGGTHPINVSMLNADRSGKVFLFSTQPPTWKSQLKSPVNKSSMFDDFSSQNINENIDYLRSFLLRFQSINLSIKNPEKQKWITKWVNSIIDDFLFYVATIQNLPSGWSNIDNIKLKIEHQYLLDPHREDTEFQTKRKNNNWQTVICNDFSRWLNNQLRGFTPQKEHTRMWQKLIKTQLREYEETIGYEEIA